MFLQISTPSVTITGFTATMNGMACFSGAHRNCIWVHTAIKKENTALSANYTAFLAVTQDLTVKTHRDTKFILALVRTSDISTNASPLLLHLLPSSGLHQIHILLTPHSQQNLAPSTGYFVPHAWQNLLFIPQMPTSFPPSTSFLRNSTNMTEHYCLNLFTWSRFSIQHKTADAVHDVKRWLRKQIMWVA